MHTFIQESDGTFAVIDPTGKVVLGKMNISGAKALCESLNKELPPKTNEVKVEEIKHQFNIKVATLLRYLQQIQDTGQYKCAEIELSLLAELFDTLLEQKDKQKEEAVAEVVEKWRKSIDEEGQSCTVKIEEAVAEAYKKGRQSFLKDITKIDHSVRGKKVAYMMVDEMGTIDWEKLNALTPLTKDIKEQMRQPQQYTKEQQAQRQAMIEQAN